MTQRILVAGIGNILLGDDGFGVEVVRRLAERELPDAVQIVDFGIHGMDLAYALLQDYDAVILVDAAVRGERPGTLYLIEPELDQEGGVAPDAHSMDPVKVLALARALGARPTHTWMIACEPERLVDSGNYEDGLMELSEPVQAAVEEAVKMVESLVADISGIKGGMCL